MFCQESYNVWQVIGLPPFNESFFASEIFPKDETRMMEIAKVLLVYINIFLLCFTANYSKSPKKSIVIIYKPQMENRIENLFMHKDT